MSIYTITADFLAETSELLQRDHHRNGTSSRYSAPQAARASDPLSTLPRRLEAVREAATGDPQATDWLALNADLILAHESYRDLARVEALGRGDAERARFEAQVRARPSR